MSMTTYQQKNAIQEIISEKQRIDILVNNAGYGLIGPIEDISIQEEIKPQFETNLYRSSKSYTASIAYNEDAKEW